MRSSIPSLLLDPAFLIDELLCPARTQVASNNALVFVNGKKLAFDKDAVSLFRSNGSIMKVDGVCTVWLRHGDRLALGNCSHILQCVAPPPARGSRSRAAGVPPSQAAGGSRSRAEGGGDNAVSDSMAVTKDGNMVTGMHLTWNQCVREVMLQRPEDSGEYSERLANMVVTRWRLPLTRAVFEESLLQAIHSAQEANGDSAKH